MFDVITQTGGDYLPFEAHVDDGTLAHTHTHTYTPTNTRKYMLTNIQAHTRKIFDQYE